MPSDEVLLLAAVGSILVLLGFLVRLVVRRRHRQKADAEAEPEPVKPAAPAQGLPLRSRPAPKAQAAATEEQATDKEGGGLHDKMDRRAYPQCPSCGANDWVLQDGPQVVNLRLDRGVTPSAIEVLLYICARCGFVRLHSTDALKGSD